MEVVVATLFMSAVAIPLFELMEGGFRSTRATIHEVRGTHLAAEIAEQVETLPFEVLAELVPTGTVTLHSHEGEGTGLREGELVDGARLPGPGFSFHLSPLPQEFRRNLQLTRSEPDLILAQAEVSWGSARLPSRRILLRRALTRDSLIP